MWGKLRGENVLALIHQCTWVGGIAKQQVFKKHVNKKIEGFFRNRTCRDRQIKLHKQGVTVLLVDKVHKQELQRKWLHFTATYVGMVA